MTKREEITEYLQQNPGESYRAIAKMFNTSHAQVGRIDRAMQTEYTDAKQDPSDNDIWAYWEALKNLAEKEKPTDRKQTVANITIKDNRPIGIAFTGDWHLGAKGLDMQGFERDMNVLAETRGLYSFGTGDYKDNQNALVHPTGVQEQDCPSNMQDKLVKAWVEYIVPKVLVRGCHDDWDKQISSRDFIEYLCQGLDPKPINLWHGGLINLTIGEETYSIKIRHKIPNESNLNTENAFRRWYDRSGKSDIFVAAHKHDPLVKVMHRQGNIVTYIRSGSYKKYDEYGQKLAGYEGTRACRVVVLFPHEHRVVPFEQLRDGVAFLKGVRS